MDPWQEIDQQITNKVEQSFQDNFQPELTKIEFAKLPDSAEYLESLERKLAKIQQGHDLLKSLEERRDAALRTLLVNDNGNSNGNAEHPSDGIALDLDALSLEEELKGSSLILKKLAPEKQAVAPIELVQLLQADLLQLQSVVQGQSQDEGEKESSDKESSKAEGQG